jgi:phage terminase Nu1 subunit (DNA packaging protein)
MGIANLTQIDAAALLGVTTRTLRDWEKRGEGPPRNDDGTYPGRQLVVWEVTRNIPAGEFDDQRERLNAAQAEKVEAENAVRRGELADVAQVTAAWVDHIAAARAKLLAIPSKCASQLTGITDANVLAAGLRAEISAALAELADYDVPAEPDAASEGVADVEAAADAHRKRVGRPRKAAQ